MKKIFSILVAVLCLGFFVSCSDDDDESGDSALVTYKTTADSEGAYCSIKFYSDSTWVETSHNSEAIFTLMSGTYVGEVNPTGSSKPSLTITKVSTALADTNATKIELIDVNSDAAATFRSEWGKLTFDIIIASGKFTFASQIFSKE